jgi:hypothetical protein
MGGDPAYGYVKTLYVLYQTYSGLFQTNVSENGFLQVPNGSAQELPMDYTQWTTSKFYSVGLTNANVSAPLGDPDGNGIPNLMKYALGMDPNVPSIAGLPQLSIITTNNNQFLTLSYYPNPYATNLEYVVEVSNDLINWNSGSGYTYQLTPNGQTPVVVSDWYPMSANIQRFMHLRVSQTGP